MTWNWCKLPSLARFKKFPVNILDCHCQSKNFPKLNSMRLLIGLLTTCLGRRQPWCTWQGGLPLSIQCLYPHIFISSVLEFPKWVIKAINKIRRAFMWRGHKEVNGGHCLVAWGRVKRPTDLGGLGTLTWVARLGTENEWLKGIQPKRQWLILI